MMAMGEGISKDRVIILPSRLSGSVQAIGSKSDAHRVLIAAALSRGVTRVHIEGALSEDIRATLACLLALGTKADVDGDVIEIDAGGVGGARDERTLDCAESGSTLRFLLPVAAALGGSYTFVGQGRLASRPIDALLAQLSSHGVSIHGDTLPLEISGRLTGGVFELPGDVSSQYVSGLLFALPLLERDSRIVIASTPESSAYIDMTLATLEDYGIDIEKRHSCAYFVRGGQRYKSPGDIRVEGDWSNAAFWLCAGAVGRSAIRCRGLETDSKQADACVLDVLSSMGAKIYKDDEGISVETNDVLKPVTFDASHAPDLVPIMTVVMSAAQGRSYITNAARLRLKESDRLHAMASNLNAIGGKVGEGEDCLIIDGVPGFHGGVTASFNDHRIAMAITIASLHADGNIIIDDAWAVTKSYPDFYSDFIRLGGKTDGLNIRTEY